MKTTYDGFEIAEKDLLLRGPGDFFSSVSDNNLRQSGGFEFKMSAFLQYLVKQMSMEDGILRNHILSVSWQLSLEWD